ncbi:MAG: site-specific integrase, partial [Azoarcus sp.]|nr:site-specific integrase [Azoarcus sp.]
RYQINGVEHYKGLGSLHSVGLNQARKLARRARASLAAEADPLQEQQEYTSVDTEKIEISECNKSFDECAEEYISHRKHEWKSDKHHKQWGSSLCTYASPYFGKMFVREITLANVLQALIPIWITKTETASRVRERIERVLSWATVCGFRSGENPARWTGHLEEILAKPSRLKKVRHYPSLPYQEIRAFYRLLNAQQGSVARALEFLILTVCRTSEVLRARWQEIDFAGRIWVVPPERIKNGKQHRVPLTDAALKILHAQEGQHPDLVFPSPKKGSPFCDCILFTLLRRMERPDITAHGFRSTFRVWVAEQTHYPRELAEMALSHKQPSAVEEAYQRSDLFERRRVLMQDWSNFCE